MSNNYIKVSQFWVKKCEINPKTLYILHILTHDIMKAIFENVVEAIDKPVKNGRITGLGKFDGKTVKVLLLNDISSVREERE